MMGGNILALSPFNNVQVKKRIDELEMQCCKDNEIINTYKAALQEIGKTCPLLMADRDGMHNERAANLFLKSTVRRMELANTALKKAEEYE